VAAPNLRLPTILAVDPDPATQKALAQAFNRSGAFLLRYISDAKKTAGGLRQLRPDLLLVHAELSSLVMEDVFRAIASLPMFAALPVVLLCQEEMDRQLLAQFRTGIVHRLAEPFRPDVHVREVAELLRALPARAGVVQGRGRPGDMAALVEHVRRTRRSGALALDPARPPPGNAMFVRGGLRSAQVGTLAGDAALAAMIGLPPSHWTFTELAGQAGDGAGIIIELDAGDDVAGIDLDVEASPPGAPADEGRLQPEGLLVAEEAPAVVPAPVPAPASAAVPARAAPTGQPIKVLLVDDDPELCRMYSIILQKRGLEVATASDGVEGYEQARTSAFDVVVADLQMPRMDGWGLLRQLRDDYRTRELPLAFLSCHDDYRESLRALDAGAQAYISKSVKHDALAQQIHALLAPRRQVQVEIGRRDRLAFQLDLLGPQWLVRELGRQRATGRLEARDSWASYRLDFRDGEVVGAHAQAGPHAADGEPAFIALLGSRSASGTFEFDELPGNPARLGALDDLLARAVLTLNEKDRRAREAMLVKARKIQVDPALYALYTQVGPKPWLPTAKLICEDRLPPAEVIARSEASPLDVEETLKDLLRRGVVTLEA
jgi:CheY-like chemotaxis protein